ncbi:MAG: DNA mismatch repair endonuclease MutL, partial [Halapricum sp.]
LESVSGLVSHPETNRASREYLSTYVNGRYVTADAVREAVMDAYDTTLASDRYPFTVLFVEIDPAEVDVNVHPRKMDVRFADSDGVREQITAAVADALRREGLLRSTAARGRSAPEQTEISPGEDVSPPATDASRADTDGHDEAGASVADRRDTPSAARGSESAARGSDGDAASASGREHTADSSGPAPGASPPGRDASTGSDRESSTEAEQEASPETDRESPSVTATDQHRFGERDPTAMAFDSLPSMRILGQLQETYVVAETDDGLVLIDQHAADERINYERLREQFLGETTTQVLAETVEIELTARESELFERFTAALSRLGFQADRIDDRTVEVRTVPALVAEAGGPELVRDVLSSFVSHEGAAAETVEAVADELLADLACYPSVTANTSLTDGSIVSLLETLAACENPYACPHGRPVLIEIDGQEIDERFERDYPGHE